MTTGHGMGTASPGASSRARQALSATVAVNDVVDVIVVGGGLAGHCAALDAAEAGASVTLLEKMPLTGGSSVLSGGFMAFADTPLQRAAGLKDSAICLRDDLRAIGGGEADEALLQVYTDQQADLYDWLVALGVKFQALEHSAGQSVARSHQADVQSMIELLAGQFLSYPDTQLLTGQSVTALSRNGQEGPISGVRIHATCTEEEALPINAALAHADSLACERNLYARGGVVLASGGFSRSEDLLRIFAPDQSAAVRIGGAGNIGDGLRMGCKIGAGLRDMARVRGTFGTHPRCTTQQHEILLAYYLGAIIVNQAGKRFVDESISYKLLGDACLQQAGHKAFQVFDHDVMDQASPRVTMFDFPSALSRGLLIKADSLASLAVACGLPASDLIATVARYNAGVDAGVDTDFGRDGLCHHTGTRVRIDRAPFYGYLSTSAVLATYCGLAVDARARVQDVHGIAIAGLYAAGEVTGGFHGSAYMTGSSLGKAALFGRIAGREAARRAREPQCYDL